MLSSTVILKPGPDSVVKKGKGEADRRLHHPGRRRLSWSGALLADTHGHCGEKEVEE